MLKNRLQSDEPTIVPVVPNPMGTQGAPVPPQQPNASAGGIMAPAMPVAPANPAMAQVNPTPTPTVPDLRQFSPAELAASSRQLFKEPGNGFSAFGQGIMNAQALKESRRREIAQQDQEKATAQAHSARQIEYLERLSPELAEVAKAGLMTPQEAFQAFRTEQASGGAKREWVTLDDGRFGWANETSGEFEELGTASKPMDANSAIGKLAQDFKNGLIDQEQYDAGLAKISSGGISISTSPDGSIDFNMGGTTDSGRSLKKLTEGLSAADADMIKAEREQARAADDLGATIDQLEMFIEKVGYTGPGGETYGMMDDMVGFLPGDKGARGAVRSLGMEAQLAMTQKTKGAITDREMGMFKAAVPGLTQTLEGNQQIIAAMKATVNRQKQRAQFMEAYIQQKGSLQNAQSVWDQYINENPVIDQAEDGSLIVLDPADPMQYLASQSNGDDMTASTPQAVTSDEDYNALQSGDLYIDPDDGKTYRKP